MTVRGRVSTIFGCAAMATGTVIAGYAIGRGSSLSMVLLAVLVLILTIMLRARQLVLAAAIASLVLGSSVNPELKTGVYYFRFLILGALLAVSLAYPALRSIRHSVGLAKFAIALIACAMVSAIWSVNPSVTLQRALSLLLLFLVVLAAARRVWATDKEVGRDLAIAMSVLGAAFMIGLAGAGMGAEWAAMGGRFRGVLENPNSVGVTGALLLPISLGFVSARHGCPRLWWVAVAGASAVSLVLSQSRGGLLAAGSGVLVLVALSRGVRRPLVVVAMCFVAVTLFTGVGATEVRLPGALDAIVLRFDQDSNAGGRLVPWSLALRLARERPVRGWGFGTTEEVFGPRTTEIARVFQGGLVHNSYLQILLELGPAGVALLLFVLSGVLRLGWSGDRVDPLRAAVYSALIAGTVSAFAESTLLSVGSVFGFTFWFLAAASAHLRWLASADPGEAAVPSIRLVEHPFLARRAWQIASPPADIEWRRT